MSGPGYLSSPPYNPNAPHDPPPYTPNFPSSAPQQGYPQPTQGYPHPSQGYIQPSHGPPSTYSPGPPSSYSLGPPSSYSPGFPQGNYPPGPPGPQITQPMPSYTTYSPAPTSYVPPGYQPPPITQQPGMMNPGMQQAGPQQPGGVWMNMPQGPANCPPGLEYLSTIDQLLVHQKVELLEALIGFETNNKFTIKNSIGQKVYHAAEDTDCLTRNCCGPYRPFDMKILDNYGNQVINIHRPLACESCCFPCCLQTVEISAPPGTVIGTIEQEWSICIPTYAVKTAAGEKVLSIEGPICRFAMCGDIEFKILALDGQTVVGKITKQWSGLLREMFTDADYFGITFPMDLDVRVKATLLGALFLIDAMFFEKSGNRETDRMGMI